MGATQRRKKAKKKEKEKKKDKMVEPGGIEPPTSTMPS
jgi:hypothetical protein